MGDRYFEDFKLGERFVSAGMTITEAGIVEFARQWDPQPFHIDAEFSKTWQYGGLIASGLHTMSAALRLWLDLGVFRACSLGSPGLGETQFPRPVRPGDTILVHAGTYKYNRYEYTNNAAVNRTVPLLTLKVPVLFTSKSICGKLASTVSPNACTSSLLVRSAMT